MNLLSMSSFANGAIIMSEGLLLGRFRVLRALELYLHRLEYFRSFKFCKVIVSVVNDIVWVSKNSDNNVLFYIVHVLEL